MLFSRASQVPDGSSTARRIDHRLKKQGWTPESLSCHTGPNMELSPCPENGLYKRKHNVTYYLKNNFHITTSGMFDTPGFRHALSVMGPERVMFSIDTAYEDISDGAGWFNSLSETVALPQKDWESIALLPFAMQQNFLTYLYVACDISDIGDSQSHWPWEFPTATGWTPQLSCRAQQRINKEWCAEMTWNDKGSETAKRHDRCNGWELTTPMDSQLLHLISVMFLTERKRAMWIFSSESLPLPWNIHCFHLLQWGYEPLFFLSKYVFISLSFAWTMCWRYPLLRSLKKP